MCVVCECVVCRVRVRSWYVCDLCVSVRVSGIMYVVLGVFVAWCAYVCVVWCGMWVWFMCVWRCVCVVRFGVCGVLGVVL